MAVYIDSDMVRVPNSCGECRFRFGGICSVAPSDVDTCVPDKLRPVWCPLREHEDPDRELNDVLDSIAGGRQMTPETISATCAPSLHVYGSELYDSITKAIRDYQEHFNKQPEQIMIARSQLKQLLVDSRCDLSSEGTRNLDLNTARFMGIPLIIVNDIELKRGGDAP